MSETPKKEAEEEPVKAVSAPAPAAGSSAPESTTTGPSSSPAPSAAAGAGASAGGSAAGAGGQSAPHRYHFMGGVATEVDSQMSTNIPRLGGFNIDQLGALASSILKFLASPASVNFVQMVEDFAIRNKANAKALKTLVRSMVLFFKGSLKYGCSSAEVKADLLHLRLAETHASRLSAVWRENQAEVSLGAVDSSLTVKQLVDLDWKFGVTVASEEVEQVGSTFLQLKLTIDNGDGTSTPVPLELSLPQFYEFMSEMEKAKTYVDLLSP